MSNSNDFIIENGVLKKYVGPGGNVVVPDGVTKIGDGAFSFCSNLTNVTVPNSLTCIGNWAFQYCGGLTSVSIPDSVTDIGNAVFTGCKGLTSITLPTELTEIKGGMFKQCSSLSSVTIPPSVKCIGDNAFNLCKSLKKLIIPNRVKSIGKKVFSDCTKLEWIKSPNSLLEIDSSNINVALVITGIKRGYYAYAAKAEKNNFTGYVRPGRWNQYDLELINNGPVYKYRLSARMIGALGRLLDPVKLTGEVRELYIEMLNKNAKKLIQFAEETNEPRIIKDLLSLNILNAKTETAVRKLLAVSDMPEFASLA